MRLGRATEAQSILSSTVAALDPTQEKNRPRLLTALGTTFAVAGEVEEACRLGGEALTGAVGMAVQPNLQDVLTLRRHLDLWADAAAVKALDERLAELRVPI